MYVPLKGSHHPIKFGGNRWLWWPSCQVWCGSGDNGFSLSCDLVKPHDQKDHMAFTVIHHPTKFGDHIVSGGMFLVVDKQDSKCLLTSAIIKFSRTHGMS